MRRLTRGTLAELPRSVRRPQYDRERLQIGMAHIGVSAARWTPSDPYAETVMAIGDRISDTVDLAKSVLAITAIFGSDMARPQLVDPIARHLRGLLCGDARFYLAERLGDE
jgi:hypothetical protein